MKASRKPTQEEISRRAHDIWEQSGRPEGRALEHWLRAEQELRLERDQAEKFEQGAGAFPVPIGWSPVNVTAAGSS